MPIGAAKPVGFRLIGAMCCWGPVDLRLRMTFAVVNVIAVHDDFVAVSRLVVVLAGFGVLFRCHGFHRCRASVQAKCR
jgi:hypothetical protein